MAKLSTPLRQPKYFPADRTSKHIPECPNPYCELALGCEECWYDKPHVAESTREKAIKEWNAINTDQHGQQLTEQKITWTEWDGDVEHLPPHGTIFLVKQEFHPRLVILHRDENKVKLIDYWDNFYILDFKKGDQFAVVG